MPASASTSLRTLLMAPGVRTLCPLCRRLSTAPPLAQSRLSPSTGVAHRSPGRKLMSQAYAQPPLPPLASLLQQQQQQQQQGGAVRSAVLPVSSVKPPSAPPSPFARPGPAPQAPPPLGPPRSSAQNHTQQETRATSAPATGRKFRARKAALMLTPTAVDRLRALAAPSPAAPAGRLIRIGVRNKGCAGLSYHLEYVSPAEVGRFDEVVLQDGVKVVIESKALFSIIGSVMDWKEDTLNAKFVFDNPNIKEACGCGESFLTG